MSRNNSQQLLKTSWNSKKISQHNRPDADSSF